MLQIIEREENKRRSWEDRPRRPSTSWTALTLSIAILAAAPAAWPVFLLTAEGDPVRFGAFSAAAGLQKTAPPFFPYLSLTNASMRLTHIHLFHTIHSRGASKQSGSRCARRAPLPASIHRRQFRSHPIAPLTASVRRNAGRVAQASKPAGLSRCASQPWA